MLVVVFSPSLFAADNASATRMIASVLVDLNHFPSESEKTGLLALAEDEGVGRAFRAVANALVNMQHAISDSDKEIICLLYTSPSPRDRTRSRMPSSA